MMTMMTITAMDINMGTSMGMAINMVSIRPRLLADYDTRHLKTNMVMLLLFFGGKM
jgi:hypothetical protein